MLLLKGRSERKKNIKKIHGQDLHVRIISEQIPVQHPTWRRRKDNLNHERFRPNNNNKKMRGLDFQEKGQNY